MEATIFRGDMTEEDVMDAVELMDREHVASCRSIFSHVWTSVELIGLGSCARMDLRTGADEADRLIIALRFGSTTIVFATTPDDFRDLLRRAEKAIESFQTDVQARETLRRLKASLDRSPKPET
jgi:hypothetical protein